MCERSQYYVILRIHVSLERIQRKRSGNAVINKLEELSR